MPQHQIITINNNNNKISAQINVSRVDLTYLEIFSAGDGQTQLSQHTAQVHSKTASGLNQTGQYANSPGNRA